MLGAIDKTKVWRPELPTVVGSFLNSSRGMSLSLSLFLDLGGMAAPPDRSIEEWLAIIAKELFGVMIAAQQPGQRISIPGAARLTFSDQSWRESVTDLVTRARLIIIAAGDGDNLTWEIEQVVKLAHPDRVIILVDGERPTDHLVPRSLSQLPHQHRVAALLGGLPAMARAAHLRWRAELPDMPVSERVMFRLGCCPWPGSRSCSASCTSATAGPPWPRPRRELRRPTRRP